MRNIDAQHRRSRFLGRGARPLYGDLPEQPPALPLVQPPTDGQALLVPSGLCWTPAGCLPVRVFGTCSANRPAIFLVNATRHEGGFPPVELTSPRGVHGSLEPLVPTLLLNQDTYSTSRCRTPSAEARATYGATAAVQQDGNWVASPVLLGSLTRRWIIGQVLVAWCSQVPCVTSYMPQCPCAARRPHQRAPWPQTAWCRRHNPGWVRRYRSRIDLSLLWCISGSFFEEPCAGGERECCVLLLATSHGLICKAD
jgi:hypothetical protein